MISIREPSGSLEYQTIVMREVKLYSRIKIRMISYTRDSSNFPRLKLDSKMFKA